MSQLKVDISGKSLRADAVQKKLQALFGEGVSITVTKYNPPTSRAERFAEAESDFENAKSIVSELKDEMGNWRDGLPENLANSDKGSQVSEAAEALENLESELEGISFDAPDFPSMY